MRKKINFEGVKVGSMPDHLLSGVFRVEISNIDVYSIERWNGLKCFATGFSFEIPFDGVIHPRRIQLMHPFGVYPFPEYKVNSIKLREKEAWKGFLSSAKLSPSEIQHISESFLEYPSQGTLSSAEYYRSIKKTLSEMEIVKKEMQSYVGRNVLIQIVDSGAKDHSGSKRNFSLAQFLTDESAKHIFNAYKENLKDDFTVSEVGAAIVQLGYGVSK